MTKTKSKPDSEKELRRLIRQLTYVMKKGAENERSVVSFTIATAYLVASKPHQ